MNGWLNDALCRQHLDAGGDDIWFDKGRENEAVAACMRCPVLPDCQTYAMSHPQVVDGVWGALTGTERVRLFARTQRKEVTEEGAGFSAQDNVRGTADNRTVRTVNMRPAPGLRFSREAPGRVS